MPKEGGNAGGVGERASPDRSGAGRSGDGGRGKEGGGHGERGNSGNVKDSDRSGGKDGHD